MLSFSSFWVVPVAALILILQSQAQLYIPQSIFSLGPMPIMQANSNLNKSDDFITTDGLQFKDGNGKPFFINGINYWSCMNLAANDEMGGNLQRLQKELDLLEQIGINTIRIMAATEGSSTHQPFRIYPVLQPNPGEWNEELLIALDRCLVEASKRNIRVIMVMGNTWQWSGGIAQLYSWANENIQVPYPRSWDMKAEPQRKDGFAGWGNWVEPFKDLPKDQDDFMKFQQRFYSDEKAQEIYLQHLQKIIHRTNSMNGKAYVDDPTILAWEPLNEPQTADASGIKIKQGDQDPMIIWHHKVSQYIKANAPKQLSTTGFESKQKEELFKQLHDNPSIDFCCAHIWAEIWHYYDMMDASQTSLQKAKSFASTYLQKVGNWSKEIGKPIILEEFGMARDNWMNKEKEYVYDTKALTTHRDEYFSHLFDIIFQSFQNSSGFSGLMPWSFGGLFNLQTQQYNAFGMVFAGDPPQEPPGWFSILQNDSTIGLISKWNDRIRNDGSQK